MAKRFKAMDLQEMIRSIVRHEIKEVVTSTINEVLSERYLRQLAEIVANRPRGVSDTLEIQGDDALEEPIPGPLDNSRRWPFEKHPMKHDDRVDEHRSTDPSSIFFEGTRPLDEIEHDAPPIEKLEAKLPKAMQEQSRVWTTLAGVNEKKKDDVSHEERVKFEEARIKRLREELDRKAL